MKPTFLLLIALAITPQLMAAKRPNHASARKEAAPEAGPTSFVVIGADGSQKNYSIDVPAVPPAPATPAATPAEKIPQQAAVLAALGWAPGFYGSTETAAMSVDYITTPVPYYLVHLMGKVGASTQPLYAAVLEDGRIVRPVVGEAPVKEMKSAKHSARPRPAAKKTM
jgi:hypothetical protein